MQARRSWRKQQEFLPVRHMQILMWLCHSVQFNTCPSANLILATYFHKCCRKYHTISPLLNHPGCLVHGKGEGSKWLRGEIERMLPGGPLPGDLEKLKETWRSPKFIILAHILEKADELGEKTLIYSKCLTTLALIGKLLESSDWKRQIGSLTGRIGGWKKGKDYLRIDGSTESGKRGALVDTFNNTDSVRVFLIASVAGGIGINLVSPELNSIAVCFCDIFSFYQLSFYRLRHHEWWSWTITSTHRFPSSVHLVHIVMANLSLCTAIALLLKAPWRPKYTKGPRTKLELHQELSTERPFLTTSLAKSLMISIMLIVWWHAPIAERSASCPKVSVDMYPCMFGFFNFLEYESYLHFIFQKMISLIMIPATTKMKNGRFALYWAQPVTVQKNLTLSIRAQHQSPRARILSCNICSRLSTRGPKRLHLCLAQLLFRAQKAASSSKMPTADLATRNWKMMKSFAFPSSAPVSSNLTVHPSLKPPT